MGVYTKTGDDGTTSLAYGTRVSKDDIRVEVYGTLDELNSFIGFLYSETGDKALMSVQNRLFAIGAFFANERASSSGITKDDILNIESIIDEMESTIQPLHCFILPGGTRGASLSHICRTICRRAERLMVSYKRTVNDEIDGLVLSYINRLSDFFFLYARYLNRVAGILDIPLSEQ